jgi:hypothetical protein
MATTVTAMATRMHQATRVATTMQRTAITPVRTTPVAVKPVSLD